MSTYAFISQLAGIRLDKWMERSIEVTDGNLKTLFADKIKQEKDSLSRFIQYSLESKSNKNVIYRKRNQILVRLLPKKEEKVGSYSSIDCVTVITHMFERMADMCEVLKSFTVNYKCLSCKHFTTNKTFMEFGLKEFGIKNVAKTILPSKREKKCDRCGDLCNTDRSLNEILTFDVEGFLQKIKLSDVQLNIVVEEQKYVLAGMIEIVPGHFVAHALRSNGEWETYNDLEPSKLLKIKATAERNVALLIYRLSHGH